MVELNGALYPHVDRLAALVAAYAHARVHDPSAAQRFRALVSAGHGELGGGKRYVKSERHDFYCDDDVLKRETLRAFRRAGFAPPRAEDYPPNG